MVDHFALEKMRWIGTASNEQEIEKPHSEMAGVS